jgi:hypothetical protein
MYRYGEYVVALVAIVVSGFLVNQGSLDAGVFSSVVTLCLGYVFGKQVATNGKEAP